MSGTTLEIVACNICGSVDNSVLHPARYDDPESLRLSDLANTFSSASSHQLNHQLVECGQCGLQYVNPRLPAAAMLQGYAAGSNEQFVSEARGREITFKRCLRLIERFWHRPPGRLLDIGTGGGSFPYVAAQRGWQVDACEPNRWLCEWALAHYGLPIRVGTVFDQQYGTASFDVVTLWDVLEHTSDPKREIGEAGRLLKDAGLLVVNYPDIGSWIARLMGRSWVFLLDVHLYYFTRRTIRRLLEDQGFEVVHVRPHVQRLSLSYVIFRAAPYAGIAARAGDRLAKGLGIGDRQVPYWMGQTLVIARKRRVAPHS